MSERDGREETEIKLLKEGEPRKKAETDRRMNKIRTQQTWCFEALQFKGLIPGGVQAALYGLGLLFTLAAGVWDQFKLHVGV